MTDFDEPPSIRPGAGTTYRLILARTDADSGKPTSVQAEFPVDRLELGRLDQFAMRHAHGMQRPLKLLHPKRQEAMQLGKFGKQIVVLPDVGLQQR